MNFHAMVRLDGKTATGIEVPPAVVEALGAGRRPAVRVSINDFTYRTTIGSMGGRYLIPVSRQVRTQAGVQAGDSVDVEIVLDTEPRTVEVPEDLASALARHPAQSRAFEGLSPSRRRAYVETVMTAKTEETRRRRIEKVLGDLLGTGPGREPGPAGR